MLYSCDFKPSAGEIIERPLAVFRHKVVMEKLCGLAVYFIYSFFEFAERIIVFGFLYRYSGTLGEQLYRVDIIEILDKLYKSKNVAADAAAEAIKRAVFGINRK